MKFLRNLLIATTAVAAMSATAAFAETTLEATYTDGTVAVTSTSEDVSVADAIEIMGDQVTVVIVPVGTDSVAEDDIYYINQDNQTGITTILAGMGMKELAETDGTEYEVWIGGSDVSETNPIIKLDFATVEDDIMYGNLNTDSVVDGYDANILVRYCAKLIEFTNEQSAAANVNGEGEVDGFDANVLVRYCAKLITSFPAETK